MKVMKHNNHLFQERTLTTREILEGVRQRRPYSRTGLLNILKRLQIHPVGKIRSHPSHYPPNTIDKVLDALGEKVVTMTQLRAVKRQVQKARAA